MLDDDLNVVLIDLGFTTRYMLHNNVHVPMAKADLFKGNLLFSTVHQMEFKKTSRRDDMVSAFYLMLALLNDQHLPFIGAAQDSID